MRLISEHSPDEPGQSTRFFCPRFLPAISIEGENRIRRRSSWEDSETAQLELRPVLETTWNSVGARALL